MGIGVGIGVGAGGGGGGGLEFALDPTTIAAGKTGALTTLRAALAGTVSYSVLAGSTSGLTVDAATGAVTIGAALTEGGTATLKARAASTNGDAIEHSFTITGGPPDLALSNATYSTTAAAGSAIGTFTLGAGETITSIMPNDGRLAIGGGGTTLVRGLAAASAGTVNYTFGSSAGRSLAAAIVASAGPSADPGFLLLTRADGTYLTRADGTYLQRAA